MALTNSEFARLTSCSESMASRLRGGKRLPSAALRDRITRMFELDPADVMLYFESAELFGRFLRTQVFSRENTLTPRGSSDHG